MARSGGNTPAARLAGAELQAKVFELVLAGATYREAGRALNLSHMAARKAYIRALKLVDSKDIRRARVEMLERLRRYRAKANILLQSR